VPVLIIIKFFLIPLKLTQADVQMSEVGLSQGAQSFADDIAAEEEKKTDSRRTGDKSERPRVGDIMKVWENDLITATGPAVSVSDTPLGVQVEVLVDGLNSSYLRWEIVSRQQVSPASQELSYQVPPLPRERVRRPAVDTVPVLIIICNAMRSADDKEQQDALERSDQLLDLRLYDEPAGNVLGENFYDLYQDELERTRADRHRKALAYLTKVRHRGGSIKISAYMDVPEVDGVEYNWRFVLGAQLPTTTNWRGAPSFHGEIGSVYVGLPPVVELANRPASPDTVAGKRARVADSLRIMTAIDPNLIFNKSRRILLERLRTRVLTLVVKSLMSLYDAYERSHGVLVTPAGLESVTSEASKFSSIVNVLNSLAVTRSDMHLYEG